MARISIKEIALKSAWIILSALIIGMMLGLGMVEFWPRAAQLTLPVVEPVGILWLNALKMTIVPLVVALLITGITAAADAARAGKLAAISLAIFVLCIILSGVMSLIATPFLLSAFPLSALSLIHI